MDLYHYYDPAIGPFKNLSDLPLTEATEVLKTVKANKPDSQCAKRQASYMEDRLHFEELLRNKFLEKGGLVERHVPHYMVIEHSPWLSTWFKPCAHVMIPIEAFDLKTVSFTYGDSHPTFSNRVTDGKEYRKTLYLYEEILGLIDKYGLPQIWNDDGRFGPERYIEAHIWSDVPIYQYFK
ncbi:hypothetical protein [Gorillibacterium sp. CAU 1737]|uniref:hypothetical protein n=1 Tax=Gorillibacterium sp. CAU 1737 TaxID=3140362 RepID=UPI0032608405